jgi:hypothetical protein
MFLRDARIIKPHISQTVKRMLPALKCNAVIVRRDPNPEGRVSVKWEPVFLGTDAKRLPADHAPAEK